MNAFKRAAALVVAVVGFAGVPAVTAAAESGSFKVAIGYVYDYTVFEHAGKTITGGPLEGVVSIVESNGGPFVADSQATAICMVYAKRGEDGLDLEAACTMTDESGDEWYLLATRRAGEINPGGGGGGRFELLGGTGAYEGVSGSCPYQTRYLSDKLLGTHSTCEWNRP